METGTLKAGDWIRFEMFKDDWRIGYIKYTRKELPWMAKTYCNIIVPSVGDFSRPENELTKLTPEEEMLWLLEQE